MDTRYVYAKFLCKTLKCQLGVNLLNSYVTTNLHVLR